METQITSTGCHNHNEQPQRITTETGHELCATTLYVEADAIRVITGLIYGKWDMLNTTVNQQQDLYSALLGLNMMIVTHAKHARLLAEKIND